LGLFQEIELEVGGRSLVLVVVLGGRVAHLRAIGGATNFVINIDLLKQLVEVIFGLCFVEQFLGGEESWQLSISQQDVLFEHYVAVVVHNVALGVS
jgi:hypothetical protein